jgi:hypothetical protein
VANDRKTVTSTRADTREKVTLSNNVTVADSSNVVVNIVNGIVPVVRPVREPVGCGLLTLLAVLAVITGGGLIAWLVGLMMVALFGIPIGLLLTAGAVAGMIKFGLWIKSA